MKKTVLVAGATGYAGRLLVEEFANRRGYTVSVERVHRDCVLLLTVGLPHFRHTNRSRLWFVESLSLIHI